MKQAVSIHRFKGIKTFYSNRNNSNWSYELYLQGGGDVLDGLRKDIVVVSKLSKPSMQYQVFFKYFENFFKVNYEK